MPVIPTHMIHAANEIGRCADNLDQLARRPTCPMRTAGVILDTVRDLLTTWDEYYTYILTVVNNDATALDQYIIYPDCHAAASPAVTSEEDLPF